MSAAVANRTPFVTGTTLQLVRGSAPGVRPLRPPARRALSDDPARPRGRDRAPVPRRALADRHDRPAAARASRHRAPGTAQRRGRGGAPDRARLDDRSVPGVHRADVDALPEPSRLPALRDGEGARLSRCLGPLPRAGGEPSAATSSRSVSAPTHLARRTSPGRLGELRHAHDRARGALADGPL